MRPKSFFATEDDLVLFYYGESARAAEIESLLAASAEARASYAELQAVLDAVGEALLVPPRAEGYGAEVWRRVAPRLPARPPAWGERLRGWLVPGPAVGRRLAPLAAAALLLLVVGYLAGRGWRPAVPDGEQQDVPGLARTLSAAGRDLILLASVAGHLESSQRLLSEVSNTESEAAAPVALGAERRWAAHLLAANRLYRESSKQGGRPHLAALLDELEPLLLELAHTPDELPADKLATLRERIEARALLFKTRVVTERLERLLREAEPGASTL
ncbi:MAG TPA: hypothetical protein VF121_06285 [Thermoanaerobaculia bacterium]|nr:hypothetical protein [Thermoanaerobaculia bacterium]